MKKSIKYFLVIAISLLAMMSFSDAKNKGTDLFQYNEKVKIEKQINGTAFLAGNEVEINEKIEGISFVAGEKVNINASQEYMFLLGLNVDLDSDINKDIFAFGENVKINKNIKRDAYLAGTTIVLNGTIDRNTYIYATTVEIKGKIKGNINVNASNIKIHKDAEIKGTLKYNEDAVVDGLDKKINTETYNISKNYTFKEYIYSFFSGYLGITIVGLVLIYFLEKVFKDTLKVIKNKKEFAITLCKGFVLLVSVPIIAITLLMTGIFSSLAILILISYGVLIYISEIFAAFIIASYIDKKWLNKKINNFTLIIIGLFIIRILSIIPVIGGFVSFLNLLLGLGILGNILLNIKN